MTSSGLRIRAGFALSLVTALALSPSPAGAQPAWPDCSTNYPGDIAPRVTDAALAADVKELCYHGFAVAFSGRAPGPISSSHFLTRQRMQAAAQMAAGSGSGGGTSLHAETRLPPGQRGQMSEFTQSGYTVEQLSSTANMPDMESRGDSETMANAVPVIAALVRGPWAAVQHAVHTLMAEVDVLYIATGSVYGSSGPSARKAGSVAVPSALFKALYSPEQGWAAAYICGNTDHPTCQVVNLATLQSVAGVDIFPALPDAVKQAKPAALPPV